MAIIRRPSVVHNFKDLLLWNRFANQVEILCGACLGSGIEILFAISWSHDQDGHHAQQSAYAKTKAQISFAVTAKLISAFVFATRIVQFLFYLNPKFQDSSSFLWLYRSICVGPVRKPHCWFSHEVAHMVKTTQKSSSPVLVGRF